MSATSLRRVSSVKVVADNHVSPQDKVTESFEHLLSPNFPSLRKTIGRAQKSHWSKIELTAPAITRTM
jgi:hypothetical protein